MRFRLLMVFTVWLGAAAVLSPVSAYQSRVAVASSDGTAEVVINDSAAIRFKVPNGDIAAYHRAEVTVNRLRRFVASGGDPKTIFAKGSNVRAGVYTGQTLICVATAGDARANNTSALALANQWAANVRRLLMMPAVALSEHSIVIPLGESRRVFIGGGAAGPVDVALSDNAVASASIAADGASVEFGGGQVGYTTAEVWVGTDRAVLEITVKKHAGAVPPAVFAEVTGTPCPSGMVKYAAEQAIIRSAALEPGARISVERMQGGDEALGAGLNRTYVAKVRMTGEGYITRVSESVVQVINSIASVDQPDVLFYSNSPERLERYQMLFAGRLDMGKPTRLLYHHQNAMGKSARLVVEITNPGALPATYRISSCTAGPMVDTVLVGYVASRSFLRDSEINASIIERIPPKSRMLLVSDTLRHLETSSGIIQMKQTDGPESYVRVSAVPPEVDRLSVGSVVPVADLESFALSEHIYPSPVKLIETDYVVGQRWAFISIGKKPIDSHDAQKRLDGNYGVTYDIRVRVQNPTAEEKKVRVLFDPAAGLAAGVFIINGEMVATKYAKPPDEVQLASYQLKPGETRSVRITTLPVAGSNYPATLIVRS